MYEYFNEPWGDAYTAKAQHMHQLARMAQVNYSLNFQDCDNRWWGSVSSAADAENYMSCDYSLCNVMDVMIEHLEKIQPRSK